VIFVDFCSDTFIEREANESPNDRNDRAIRVTAKWYQDHLKDIPSIRVLLLTNDRDNKRKAELMGVKTMTGTRLTPSTIALSR
jgi:exosome complex exonuclease DIS3/RRP44